VNGYKPNPEWNTQRLTDADKAKILAMRAEGVEVIRIAAAVGFSSSTVKRFLRTVESVKAPRPIRNKHDPEPRFNAEEKAEIKRLYFQERLTQPQIAKRYGVSHTTIGKVVNAEYKAQKAVKRG
jgi:transposase-like protein